MIYITLKRVNFLIHFLKYKYYFSWWTCIAKSATYFAYSLLHIENQIMLFPLKTQTSLIFYGSGGFRRKCITRTTFCNNNLEKRTRSQFEIYHMSRYWNSSNILSKKYHASYEYSPCRLMAIESEPYWTLES